jgi:hypothetical protein
MAAEVGADLRLALLEQVVVDRCDRVDDQRAVVVLDRQQRLDLGHHLVDVHRLIDDRAGGGDELVVVLRAALAVDDVTVGELDRRRGLAHPGRPVHEELEAFGDGLGFPGSQQHRMQLPCLPVIVF